MRISRVVVALVALTAITLVVRLGSIGYLLPHDAEPDAQIVAQAREFKTGVVELEFARSTYPHLWSRVLSLLPLEDIDAPADEAHLAEHLRAAARPYLEARILLLLVSVLLVPLTYVLARAWLGAPASLLAAALVATSLLHTNFSQQARPHGAFATAAALCLVAAIRLRRRGATADHVRFGAALAVAIGTLHTALLLIPLGPLALLLRARDSERPTLRRIAIPVAFGIAAGLAFWPFLFERPPEEPWREGHSFRFPHQMESTWTGIAGLSRPPLHFWRNEPVFAVCALFGALWVFARLAAAKVRRDAIADAAIVLAFVVPYVLFFALRTVAYPRFLLPVLAPLAVLAAVPFDALVASLRGRARIAIAATAALAAIAFPAYASGRLLWLRARPDSLEIAAEKIRALGPPASVCIASQLANAPPLLLDVDRASADLVREFPQASTWIRYLVRLRDRGIAIDGWPYRGLQREGRLPISDSPTRDERLAFAWWLVEPAADAYVLFQLTTPQQKRAVAEALGAAMERAEWIPEEPPLGWIQDSSHQGDGLLQRVLARTTWGPAIQLHTGLRPDRPRRHGAAADRGRRCGGSGEGSR